MLLAVVAPVCASTFGESLAAQLRLGVGTVSSDEDAEMAALLDRFYRARSMAPLWVSEREADSRATQLAALLAAADDDALDPDDYGARAIDALLGATDAELLAQLEVRLSLGLLKFVSDLGTGRVAPHVNDPALFPARAGIDKAVVIEAVANTADMASFIDRYRPQTPRYGRLKAALAHYRALAEDGGWDPIADGPTLKPGMTDSRVGPLRRRLRLWGDLADNAEASRSGGDPNTYDDALADAVKRMQYRHGLAQDGAVGPRTLAALNVPIESRIEQIMLNLERRRWMPDDLGQRYVFVNLADFNLKVVDEPRTIFESRVIVGKPYHRSPVFSESMKYIVINPYWNVPPSIARNEMLPKIKKDITYLSSNNYRLFSDWSSGARVVDPANVDWSAVTARNFHYKVRQEPGDQNALGRIKFMLPNRFNVYLHDTPAKSLFDKPERSFSHGCIRVQRPHELAELVLADQPEWSRERIDQTIASGEHTIVPLSAPLPVHVAYITAWANKDGTVHFRRDIYRRDAQLAESLLGYRAHRLAGP